MIDLQWPTTFIRLLWESIVAGWAVWFWIATGLVAVFYAWRNARRSICTLKRLKKSPDESGEQDDPDEPDNVVKIRIVRDRLFREVVVAAVQIALLLSGVIALIDVPGVVVLLIAGHVGLAWHSYLAHKHSNDLLALIWTRKMQRDQEVQSHTQGWDDIERRRQHQEVPPD